MYVFTITIHNRSSISMEYGHNLNNHLFSIRLEHNNNLLSSWRLGRIPTKNTITFYFVLGEYCYHIPCYSLRPCILVLRCIVWTLVPTNLVQIPKNYIVWLAKNTIITCISTIYTELDFLDLFFIFFCQILLRYLFQFSSHYRRTIQHQ